MFRWMRLMAVWFLAVAASATIVGWITSYARPRTWFLDFVGSIRHQRELAEELRTRGQATSNNPWFGPVGMIGLQEGTLTLEYMGGEWTGSIPPHPQSTLPTPQVTEIGFGEFYFYWRGASPPWSYGEWKCALPLWFTFVLLAIYPSSVLVNGPLRRWARHRRGRCVKCGYDLTCNTSGVCPECGTAVHTPASENDARNP